MREPVSSTGVLLSIPVSFTENTEVTLADYNNTLKVRWFPSNFRLSERAESGWKPQK